jgi:hypothetical protein
MIEWGSVWMVYKTAQSDISIWNPRLWILLLHLNLFLEEWDRERCGFTGGSDGASNVLDTASVLLVFAMLLVFATSIPQSVLLT